MTKVGSTGEGAGGKRKPRVRVRRYQVDICDPCIELQGQECHTPGCIFFLCTMSEVTEYLDRMLLRPKCLEELKGEEPYHKAMQREAPIVSCE